MIDMGQEQITESAPARRRGHRFTSETGRAAGRKSHRFDTMSREEHLALASRGGKTTQARGTGHRFTSETGRAAGRKGGSRLRVKDAEHALAHAVGTHTCSNCGSALYWNGSTWLCRKCNG